MGNYRHSLRAKRKQLSPEIVSQASFSVAEKIIHLSEFLNSEHIVYYAAHENEIDPSLISDYARELNKLSYLPVFSDQNTLSFYFINDYTQFKKNKFDIA
ncbi:MAG: hypothetical protein NTU49_08905, partial [Gammaproteobacteria bacterium]|nr:hypothetical protein [Gammaproteobacteria bacterium]